MTLRFKYWLLLSVVSVVFTACVLIARTLEDNQPCSNLLFRTPLDIYKLLPTGDFRPISCIFNEQVENEMSCIIDKSRNLFIPFTFLQKYDAISGELIETDNGSVMFNWYTTNVKLYQKPDSYSYNESYMFFQAYDVAARNRVVAVSAQNGMPISNQWDRSGYYYATQIAQFGLSHYSKMLSVDEYHIELLPGRSKQSWSELGWVMKNGASLKVVSDSLPRTSVHFETSEDIRQNNLLCVPNDAVKDFTLSAELTFTNNGSLSVDILTAAAAYRIFYVQTDYLFMTSGYSIYYGLGQRHNTPFRLIRRIQVDLLKALKLPVDRATRQKYKILRINAIMLHGAGTLRSLNVSSSNNLGHFMDAADWLVQNQDERGGWSIPVVRKVEETMKALRPGWYSSMAQGQSISLLVRAFAFSGEQQYLESACRGVGVFSVSSEEGGIVSRVFDQFVWYEEYPTLPAMYVLNGFIYSLFGLHDLSEALGRHPLAPRSDAACNATHVRHLFHTGLRSLHALLPLFDSGFGTFYDLRHLTTNSSPNLARWDYHALHIMQLQFLAIIDPTDLYDSLASRWIAYMKGKRARYN